MKNMTAKQYLRGITRCFIIGVIMGIIMSVVGCKPPYHYGVGMAGTISAEFEAWYWKKDELETPKEKLLHFIGRSMYFVGVAAVGAVTQLITS